MRRTTKVVSRVEELKLSFFIPTKNDPQLGTWIDVSADDNDEELSKVAGPLGVSVEFLRSIAVAFEDAVTAVQDDLESLWDRMDKAGIP